MTRAVCPTCKRVVPEKALTTYDVALILGCSDKAVTNFVRQGRLSCWRVGRADRRFEPSEVRRFMKELGVPQERLP